MVDDIFCRINSPIVIGEVLDGEAIIVNLDTGAYYSLDGAGSEVWMAAQAGTTLSHMIGRVASRFSGSEAEIAAGVQALVEALMAEVLLVADRVPSALQTEGPSEYDAAPADRPPFVKPVLQKYTDMADLLLLDPIHEVDEGQGWPHPAPRR